MAKLTLGLYAFICRQPGVDLFPGYQWANADIWQFSPRLRENAQALLKWSRGETVVLNPILISQHKISSAVTSMLRRSPYSRRRKQIATHLRKKYPLRKIRVSNAKDTLIDVGVLGNLDGQPITDGAIRLIRGFRPTSITVLAHNDQWVSPHTYGAIIVRLRADGYTIKSLAMTIAAPEVVRKPVKIDGLLNEFSETGTEGLLWVIEDFDGFGYEKLHFVEAGDHLTIHDRLGHQLWSGVIKCDEKAGWRRYPANPGDGQPCALGRWVHWTQKGFKPDEWARFFVRPKHDRLHGILIRKRARAVVHRP